MNDESKIVNFGRYKGKPVSQLLQDDSYCKWLKTQHWVRPWLRTLLDSKTYCGICNDNPAGMYAGEDDYIECPGCGNGRCGRSLYR